MQQSKMILASNPSKTFWSNDRVAVNPAVREFGLAVRHDAVGLTDGLPG
jgi:hypothetical protein